MKPQNYSAAKKALHARKTAKRAAFLPYFFKTGPGQYGEGDKFLGISNPDLRKTVKEFSQLPEKDILKFLKSPWHEERAFALLTLVKQFSKADEATKKKIYKIYLSNTSYINNWDLVDLTANHIVGEYLIDKDRSPLYKLAKSKTLWERRIAIISTFQYIRQNDFKETLAISKLLLNDKHDLMHKAVGWMLREVGKRDEKVLEKFLNQYATKMPRTALRYSIERFEEKKRKSYLSMKN